MYRVATTILLVVATASVWAETPRARPPEFTAEDRAVFFDDAFATLVGERPTPSVGAVPSQKTESTAVAGVDWSDLVSPDVLETEIKRQATRLAKATRSASAFKAGGYRDASDALGNVALKFAIIHEHPSNPRWKDAAEAISVQFAEAAVYCDAATDEAAQAAAKTADFLARLIRGERDTFTQRPRYPLLGERASRNTIMRRMGAAEEERLRGWTAGERAFRRNSEDVRHEAQILAALAEAAIRPGADDAGDPDYQAFARRLRDASVRLAEAAEAEDQPAAAAAMTEVSRSCVDCHADYRG